MSTVIRSCPGCKSLILSDTDQCPDCGHVFHHRKQSEISEVVDVGSMKSGSATDPCPHCGEPVRTGLVRCWSCNGFMREDIAARYRDMTSNPQQIIYSTIPLEQRTDYLPRRDDKSQGSIPKVYDAEDFVLSDDSAKGSSAASDTGFARSPVSATAKAGRTPSTVVVPDKPETKTAGEKSAAPQKAEAARSPGTSDAEDKSSARTGATASTSKPSGGEEDLLSIAMQEEREVKKRRGDKLAERARRQMLVPCPCGAWVRVQEDQAGKTVRCRQCKQAVQVPQLRRKTEKKDEKPATAKISVAWVEDVRFIRLVPTSLVLKPGSLADKFIEADLAITDSQIVVIELTGADKKKRGLLAKAPKIDRAEQRKVIRDQVAATGDFKSLPDVEVHPIAAERVAEIRLVQPVLKAHESMFAGVPVFGDGRIALFLPITLDEGQQAFVSTSLTAYRAFSESLKKNFKLDLPATENGVPAADKPENLSCFINQSRVEAVRSLIYYQQDSAFELELSGYRCQACSVVISEEGRLKNKLGGANGKGIAKAKCPKCGGKMGEEPLYRIKKSPAAVASGENAEA